MHGNGNTHEFFCIRATLVKDPSRQPQERLRGYHLYRDGVRLANYLIPMTNYTDTLPVTGQEVCYEVKCYYNNMATSDGVMVCLTINGVGLMEVENGLKVYPNPIQRNETITVETSQATDAMIRIFDMSGSIVKVAKIQGTATSIQINMDTGVYFLKIGDRETVKLVVK